VEAPDRTGILARIARALAKSGINVEGFVADASGIQIVSHQGDLAASIVRSLGCRCGVTYVQEIRLPDQPGALAELCERLANAGVNLPTAFGAGTGGTARVYLSVSDVRRAGPIIASYAQPASPAPSSSGA